MSAAFRFFLLFLPILALALAVVWIEQSRAPAPSERLIPEAQAAQAIETPQERALEQTLEEIGASLDGQLGIAVTDISSGRTFDFNGDDLLPQQSVSKLWVAMTALAQVDAGELDLQERVTMGRQDLTVFYQPIRNIVRSRGSFTSDYADLMRRAMAESDNSANDRLLRRVGGPEVVQAWLDSNGLGEIRFGTDERSKQSRIAGLAWNQAYSYRDEFFKARDRLPDAARRAAFESYLADPVDGAGAIAMAQALALLARGELLSESSTALLLDIMREAKSGPRRLKGGVPEGWDFGHKTGTGQFFDGEQSGYNDVGILTAPDGSAYAIAVLIGRTREPTPARMDMMQAVTRAVAAFHEAKKAAQDAAR